MIQPNELRIGNYFHPGSVLDTINIPCTGVFNRVGAINKFGEVQVIEPEIGHTITYNNSEVHPIPLSPEILEKAGFERITRCFGDGSELECWQGGRHKRYFMGQLDEHMNGTWWLEDTLSQERNFHSTRLVFLHQLQNLYFAITFEELKIEL